MKKIYLLSFLFLLCFAACKNDKKVEAITEMSKTFAFSDTLKLDTFKVALTGQKSADMMLNFTIKNFNGKKIYQKSLTATELLKSYLDSEDLKKENDKIAFINKQINAFFTEEHFLEPAVTEQQELDTNTPDEAFYNELKQTQFNGFYYSLGKDKSIYIAWSTKEQRVKTYYKCC
ncbi:MAG: hypothetical protein V4546_05735 [Bacteroidota bacterium]|uniref:Lipoprotein n=1 Tax=Pedobacter cryotolerans TaxID=2571270 RepID=A0A4U1C031_9SPHI|nr:hypothetical protein [Pedobacter cryotolerans]TKB98345.1 hypothetical protein FA045_13560 [Pedobacter cryotolerans]